ncbi:protein NRT1/ PTR FAMILY 6.2-like [Quercus suber]|uniref:protein NRT1/ PTR FAMILY 6.2-like n=1 Tax=Quercus suber TaxID=58331 RepID=UPI0032DF21D3
MSQVEVFRDALDDCKLEDLGYHGYPYTWNNKRPGDVFAIEEGKMNSFDSDAFDYKGNPADRTKTGGWLSAVQILGIEMCERLSSMAIIVNLVTYLVDTMHMTSASASNFASTSGGTSYLLCLFGGIVADSFLGRYWTIAIAAVIHAGGTCLLAISTALPNLRPPPCDPALSNKCVKANSLQMGIFTIAVYLTNIGMGGIKSSVPGLGTDQFDLKDAKESAQMARFFDRFHFVTNLGTLLAVTVLVYIQDEVGRSWAYGICAASMILAILVFVLGTKRHRHKKRFGTPILQILQVIVAAVMKRKTPFPSNVSALYEDPSQESIICHTDKFRCLDKAAIITSVDSGTPNPWRLCTVTRVEKVKMLVKLLPIWATTIIFWTIHAQLASFSVQQAATMDRSIGKFQIPPASLYAFFVVAIIITLATYDRLIMPLMKKTRNSQGLTSLQKIGLGLFFSILGMAAAALVEKRRLLVVKANRGTVTTLPVSTFFLLPQFILVGIGEAFMLSGELDFFTINAPIGMKAISTGLYLTTTSFGMFFSTILVTILTNYTGRNGGDNWLPPSINDGRLDYFYWLLALLTLINLGFYILCAVRFIPNSTKIVTDMNGGAIDTPPKEENV